MQAVSIGLCIGFVALFGRVMPAAELGPVRLYVAISGETEATEQRRLTGWSDVRLSSSGRQRARALASLLPPTLDDIYTSSLTRAMETAQLASGRFSVTALPDLRPRNIGPFVGASIDDRAFTRRRSLANDNLDGGETLPEYRARLYRAVMEIRDNARSGNILLIVHQSTAADVLNLFADVAGGPIKVPLPGEVIVVEVVRVKPLQSEDR